MKKFFPLTVLLFISLFSFAQYENFDLSKYKLPEIKRHELDFRFGLNNNYSSNTFDDADDASISEFNQNLATEYNYFFNSHKAQKDYKINTRTLFETEKLDNYQDEPYRNGTVDLDLNFDLDNYFYLKEDKWFLHVRPDLAFSYEREYSKLTDFKESTYAPYEVNGNMAYPFVEVKSFDREVVVNPEISLGFGYGRIEPVGDVRHAIYIVEELAKKNRLNRVLSENEIMELATKISQVKNKRFFDSRLRRMYEIQSIDSLLIEANVIDNQDAIYFMSLTDMWMYGGQTRSAGTRISFNVQGGMNYDYTQDFERDYDSYENGFIEDELKNSIKYEKLGANIMLESDKPIGLKLQRYLTLSASYSDIIDYRFSDNYDYTVTSLDKSYNIISSYQLNWDLNTRTFAYINGSVSYSNRNYKVHDYNYSNYDYEYIRASIRGSLYYYFSPRLRLSLNTQIEQNWYLGDNSYYDKTFQFYTSASVNYAIF